MRSYYSIYSYSPRDGILRGEILTVFEVLGIFSGKIGQCKISQISKEEFEKIKQELFIDGSGMVMAYNGEHYYLVSRRGISLAILNIPDGFLYATTRVDTLINGVSKQKYSELECLFQHSFCFGFNVRADRTKVFRPRPKLDRNFSSIKTKVGER